MTSDVYHGSKTFGESCSLKALIDERAAFLLSEDEEITSDQFVHLRYLLQATQKVRIKLFDACCRRRIHTPTCYCMYFKVC